MDEKADNPQGLDGALETARTAMPAVPSALRTEPSLSIAPDLQNQLALPPAGAPQPDVGENRIEPVFTRSEDGAAKGGGFFPAGAGLVPAALLGDQTAAGVEQDPPSRRAHPRRNACAPAAAIPASADTSSRRSYTGYARLAAKWLVIAAIAWSVLMGGLILLYRFVDPPFSALMAQRWLSGETVDRSFVPIDAMAPALVKSVLVSEDGRFCEHHGIDFDAIQTAIEKAGDGTPRGASTISMQVAKNLFLWPSKSYLRKALEVPLTLGIELVWPKRRIMEVYLNIAEWGPGVYGAEAAARHHFSKPALHLSDREAALLAVALPNPITRDAGQPGAGTRRLSGLIQARANRASRYQTSCVLRQTARQQGGWQPQVRREGGR